ncbi:MAG: hypothetical protein KDB60_12340 [Propionibacteriaceae bacterium]|nr:hypothetical protein [Propionibacteriaceae bacterium]
MDPTPGERAVEPARTRAHSGLGVRARRILQAGALALAIWVLIADIRVGTLPGWSVAIGIATIVFAGAASVWRLAWLGVAVLFVVSAAVPWETSATGFILLLVAVFDTGAHRPGWLGLVVLGSGLAGLLLDAALGGQDAASTVAFSFVLIAVATVGSLLRAQADRVEAVEELALLRRQVERTELARDMHDIVAAPMSHVVLIATDLLTRNGMPSYLRTGLEAVQAEARESLEELRAMLGCLRTDTALSALSPSTPESVRREWQASLARLSSRGFVPEAHFDMNDEAGQPDRDEVLRLAVRELTTNVLRHSAPPGRVRMTLVATPEHASVVVANRLTGPPHGQPPASGLGLQGLQERARACGGLLRTTTMDEEWLAVLTLDSPAAP